MKIALILIIVAAITLGFFGYSNYRRQIGLNNVKDVEINQHLEQEKLLRESLKNAQEKVQGLSGINSIGGDFSQGNYEDFTKSLGGLCQNGRGLGKFIGEEEAQKALKPEESLVAFCPYGKSNDKLIAWRYIKDPNSTYIGFFNLKSGKISGVERYPIRFIKEYCSQVTYSDTNGVIYINCEYPGASQIYKINFSSKQKWNMQACYKLSDKIYCAKGCVTNNDCSVGQSCIGTIQTCATVKQESQYESGPYY